MENRPVGYLNRAAIKAGVLRKECAVCLGSGRIGAFGCHWCAATGLSDRAPADPEAEFSKAFRGEMVPPPYDFSDHSVDAFRYALTATPHRTRRKFPWVAVLVIAAIVIGGCLALLIPWPDHFALVALP